MRKAPTLVAALAAFLMLGGATASASPALSTEHVELGGSDTNAVAGLEPATRSESSESDLDAVADQRARVDNPVVASWYDKDGRLINLRAYAQAKVRDKHGLTTETVRKVTERYVLREYEGGTVYRYLADARRVVCNGGSCNTVETVRVKVVVDFRRNPNDNRQQGVVTAYCLTGIDRCPSWVNTSIN